MRHSDGGGGRPQVLVTSTRRWPASLWARVAEGLYGIADADEGRQILARGYVNLGLPGSSSGPLGPFLPHWLRRGDARHPIRFAARLVTGRASLRPLVIVSHHFMSRAETETPLGKERLDLCVFQVPIDGRLMPMCQVNTGGARDEVYAQLARSGTTQLTPRQEVS